MLDENDPKQLLREKIVFLTNVLQTGCGRKRCFAPYCAANPSVKPLQKVEAFKLAMEVAKLASEAPKNDFFICKSEKIIEPLQRSTLEPLLEKGEPLVEKYADQIYDVFSNHLALNFSFAASENIKAITEKQHNLDFESLEKFRKLLEQQGATNSVLKKCFVGAVDKLFTSLSIYIKKGYIRSGIELRVFPLLYVILAPLEAEYGELLVKLVELHRMIPVAQRTGIDAIFEAFPKHQFVNLVDHLRNKLSSKFLINQIEPEEFEMDIESSDHSILKPFLVLLGFLHKINVKKNIIPNEEFYVEVITEELDLGDQIKIWWGNKTSEREDFTFIDYPWILECAYKSKILDIEGRILRERDMNNSLNNLLGGMNMIPQDPDLLASILYLKFEVRRDQLIPDTLNRISNPNLNFKKTLKVKFVGEQGVDEGGVRKEFFQLMTKQLFDPTFTMFIPVNSDRYLWFNQHSFECNLNFELCGVILGLAIYNSINLDVKFPTVVYKKLLDEETTFEDLKYYDEQIYNSMKKLLEFDGDVESFGLTFQVQHQYLGEVFNFELLPDGANKPVTSENKEEYVNLYINWLFNESIKTQFKYFYKGFQKVVSNSSIKLFTGEELNSLICGSEVLNFAELKKVVHYQGGYTKDSSIIVNFWEIIESLSDEEKKKFLFFCTGSDKAPINGLGTLDFVIERHGEDSERLPSAHTCFNHLLLPEYSSKEKLHKKLLLAIDNSQGFGLI